MVQGVGDIVLGGLLLSLARLAGEVLFSLLAVSLLPRLGPVVLSTWAGSRCKRAILTAVGVS